MNVRKLIQSPKEIRQTGQWATGTMPRSAFPLSRSGGKAYRLGNRRWRVIVFDACAERCRVLINYHPTFLQYQALLGVDIGGDTKVLASLEHHPTHKPWHAHVCCADFAEAPAGIRRGPWFRSLNGAGRAYKTGCPSSDDAAFNMAAHFFRLDRRATGGLV